MGTLTRVEESEIINYYALVRYGREIYFVDRRKPSRILRKLSHNTQLREFRAEVLDASPLKTAVRHVYQELLAQGSR